MREFLRVSQRYGPTGFLFACDSPDAIKCDEVNFLTKKKKKIAIVSKNTVVEVGDYTVGTLFNVYRVITTIYNINMFRQYGDLPIIQLWSLINNCSIDFVTIHSI